VLQRHSLYGRERDPHINKNPFKIDKGTESGRKKRVEKTKEERVVSLDANDTKQRVFYVLILITT